MLRTRILFGKKVKPSGHPWKIATTFPANPAQIKLLTKEQDNRCQNCGIQFGRKEDDKPVVVRGDGRKQVLTCKLCNASFHTEALKRHTEVPTW